MLTISKDEDNEKDAIKGVVKVIDIVYETNDRDGGGGGGAGIVTLVAILKGFFF